ncbi:MAG: hypothetical protein HY536_00320, partial [Candidatus Colwellbacteria bacterium]|nr:hypothetical protein [Candidatus Colwellbacteria bacterium]
GDEAKRQSLRLIEELRGANIEVSDSLGRESLRSQLRVADKSGASVALIFGQKEAFEESIIVRDMGTGAQETVPLAKMVGNVKKRMETAKR